MRKIYLLFLMLMLPWVHNGQISYSYDWEPTSYPVGHEWSTSGSGEFGRNTTTPCAGSASARANNYYTYESYLVSPALANTNGGDLTVSFKYKVTNYNSNTTGASATNFGELRVEWAPSVSGPWSLIHKITSQEHVVSASCTTKTVTGSGLVASGSVFVRFVAKSGTSSADNYVYIDDVVISQGPPPSCFPPTNVTFSNITTSGVTLNWVAPATAPSAGYLYEVRTDTNPGVPGVELIASGPTGAGVLNAAVSTLTANTSYNVYVRGNCGVGDLSLWSLVSSFTTLCFPQDLPYTVPLAATSGSALPACVSVQNSNGDAITWVTASAQTGITGRLMSLSASSTLASDDWFYTKGLNLTANQVYKVSFKYKKGTAASTQKLKVMFGNTPVQTGMTNLITDLSISESSTIASSILNYYFVPTTSGVYYLGFNGYAAASQGTLYVGEISVELGPTCVVPGDINITSVTKNSATINWTAPVVVPTNGYEYEIRTTGDPGSGAVGLAQSGTATSSELFKNLVGLAPSTEYKVYVRSVCSATNPSAWTDVKIFKTLCNYPDLVSTTPASRCGTGPVNLSASYSNAEAVNWYASETATNVLGTGNTYLTPNISSTTSYWVSAESSDTVTGAGGKSAPLSNSTASTITDWGIIFNVLDGINLTSTDVYSTTAGTLGVKILNPAGQIILNLSNIPISNTGTTSPNVISLNNIYLEPGTGYKILIASYSGANLVRDNSSLAFPYIDPLGNLNVTSSEWGGATTSAYYYFYNLAYTKGCSSSRTEVVATVTPGPELTLSETEFEICNGDSVVVTVEEGAENYDSYVWEPATGVSGNVTTGWTFNPSVSSVYTLTASQTTGDLCAQIIDVDFTVIPLPVFTPINSNFDICVDEIKELNPALVTTKEVIVGTSNTTSGTSEAQTAFMNRFAATKQQYIYTKEELNALGFYSGPIMGLAFDIISQGSSTSNTNYTIKMKSISESSFANNTFLTGGFTTVYGPSTYTRSTIGWQTIDFSTPFVWDGTSNILIELTHLGVDLANNAETKYSVTSVNRGITAQSSTASSTLNATTGNLTSRRLNTKFILGGIASGSWSPVTNLYSDALATVPYAGENISKVYVKGSVSGSETYTFDMVNDLGCETSLSTTVNVIEVAAPVVAAQSICSTEVSNIIVTGLQTGGVFKWYETETSTEELDEIPATGTYFVEQVVGTCKSDRVSVAITLNLQLPAPVAPVDQKFCLDTVNTSYTVADLEATETTGTIGWFLNEDDTTPLALTDVLAAGTYYVAEFNGTCWSPKKEVEVAIGTMPAAPNGASQAFCSSLTLGDVEVGQVSGATVNWYATADATETLDTESVLTDATYYVSQIIGFCESERVAIQIQLIPVFDAPIVPSPVLYCQETTFDDLEVTLLPGGSKGWFTSIATAEPNIELTDVVTTGTYYVAQHNGACWSNKTPVVVTVNPTPAALNNAPQTLCGTFTLADANLGQMEDAIVNFYSSVTSDEVLPMTNPLVTGTYYVSQTLGGCESDRVTVNFEVYEILPAPIAPDSQFFCGLTTVANLDATATSGVIGWFTSADSDTPLSSTTSVSTGVYYVAQANGVCWSDKVMVNVTVNPVPATLNNSAQQLCGVFTLADAVLGQVSNATVKFYTSETSDVVLPLTTPLVTGVYYVSQEVDGCESPRVSVNYTVNEILPIPQAQAIQNYCGITTFADLNAVPTTGVIGWFTEQSSNTPLAMASTVTSGTYYVAQLNGNCWSEKASVQVTINSVPASLSDVSQQLCGTFVLADAQLGQAENAILKFYSSENSNVVLPLTTPLVTGVYYVSQMVGMCESPRVTVNFVVNEILSAPEAPATQNYCGVTTVAALNAVPTSGVIGWFTSQDSTSPLAATVAVTSGTYYVAQLNGNCWSPKTQVQVNVNPVPIAPSNNDIQLCGNYNFGQVSIGQIAGATLKWYISPTAPTAIQSSTNVTSGTYYVSQTVGGCESVRVAVNISQTDSLGVPTVASQTFCGAATVADLVAGGVSGATIVWYSSASALNPLSSNTNLATGTYYATQTKNGCVSARVPVSVFVVTLTGPVVDPFNFCGSATVSDLVIPAQTGVVYKWFDSPSNPTPLNLNTVLVTGTYFVSRSQFGCESLRTPVTVNIHSVPNAPTGVNHQVFIEGSTINDIVMDQQNVIWYISLQNAQTGINPLVPGMPLVNGTTYYGVIIGTNGCPSAPFVLTVDVYLSDDKFVKEELRYFPNPVEDLLTITYSDRIILIEVFDLLGKRVKVKSTDDKEVNVDLSDLASGTYMVQLKTENKSQFIKIIKK